ncbi:MAG: hypothetical protein ABJ195_13865 [Marinomonas sp.]|uniref:hypothetical protein n=1 Tax=Sphingomonadales TaxID=204457 RepID=UPI003263E96D
MILFAFMVLVSLYALFLIGLFDWADKHGTFAVICVVFLGAGVIPCAVGYVVNPMLTAYVAG